MRASASLISRKSHSAMVAIVLNPVIHGVAAGQAHAVHLRAHAALQRRLNVAQQQVRRLAVALRQLRVEVREHVQIRAQRSTVVHVARIDARPKKRFARRAFQPFKVDAAARQELFVLLREVVAHDTHDLYVREIARGQRDIGTRSAQGTVHAAMRRFNPVVRDGPYGD